MTIWQAVNSSNGNHGLTGRVEFHVNLRIAKGIMPVTQPDVSGFEAPLQKLDVWRLGVLHPGSQSWRVIGIRAWLCCGAA